MEATLERKLRLLAEHLGYYPFWHNGCDGDGQGPGWVVSQEFFSCRKSGILFGSPRYGSRHHDTPEAAADEALRLLADRAAATEQQAERERAAAQARREACGPPVVSTPDTRGSGKYWTAQQTCAVRRHRGPTPPFSGARPSRS